MDDSQFVKVFGKSPKILVIDYLLDNLFIDFHKSDMADQTGISRSTLDIFFNELIVNGFIVRYRKIGRAQMYMTNKKNPIIQRLAKLDRYLSKLPELSPRIKNDQKPKKHKAH